MSANVEILGEKRDKAVSIPLEALQRREGKTVAYRLKANLEPQEDRRREGRPLRAAASSSGSPTTGRTTSTPSRSRAGIATLERVEIVAGLKAGEQVALEDPTKKVEKDEEDN